MVGVSDAQQVTDNQAESRFELWVDGLLAELQRHPDVAGRAAIDWGRG